MIVAVDDCVETFVAVNVGSEFGPLPLVGSPIEGSELVQKNHCPAPGRVLEKDILPELTTVPLQ